MLQLARLCDRDGINAIARQVHAMHVAWRPDIFEMTEELFSPQRMENAVRERGLYVAKTGDRVIGYACVEIRDYGWPGVVPRKVMLVDEIAVDENCRGRGIGTTMMEDIRALAKAFGCTDLQLGVYPQNDGAVAFYQKCGFTIRSIEMQRKV